MIAGLPGTGIGGLFYMLIALWMPVNEVIDIIRGRANPKNMQLVKTHILLTSGILIAVIATGWLAGCLAIIILFSIPGASTPGASTQVENFLQIAPIILSFLTLIAVYLAMHVLRLAIRVHKFISAQRV